MTTETWELPDIIELMVKDELDGVFTALSGRVESYDRTTQRARIQPTMLQKDGSKMPLLGNVPVVWPCGSGGSLHMDLEKGSPVVVLFLTTSAFEYMQDGKEGRASTSKRRFGPSSAMAFPGGMPLPKALTGAAITDGAAVLAGDSQVVLEAPEIKAGAAATQAAALAPPTEAYLNTIDAQLKGLGLPGLGGGINVSATKLKAE